MVGHMFERFDRDNDGRIALAELPVRIKVNLSAIDTNKDGVLTRAEFDQGQAQLMAQREKMLDRNGDGKVTDEERRDAMRAHVVERFVEQDKNHDGALTEVETQTQHWNQIKSADANSDSRVTLDELKVAFDEGKLRPFHHHGPGPSEADMKAHAQKRFTDSDKNNDGFLTESEVGGRWSYVKAADANQDDKVTFDELTSAFKAGKLGRQGGHGHGPDHKPQTK
jgi:Ca2+-binding EF-hand superfamily protein